MKRLTITKSDFNNAINCICICSGGKKFLKEYTKKLFKNNKLIITERRFFQAIEDYKKYRKENPNEHWGEWINGYSTSVYVRDTWYFFRNLLDDNSLPSLPSVKSKQQLWEVILKRYEE